MSASLELMYMIHLDLSKMDYLNNADRLPGQMVRGIGQEGQYKSEASVTKNEQNISTL